MRSMPRISAAVRSETLRVFRDVVDVAEGALHQLDQAVVHLLLRPEELLAALQPLEVGDGDAAGVGDDVRHDGDAALGEDGVGLEIGRAVGALYEQATARGVRRCARRSDSAPRRGSARRRAARAAPAA